MENIQHFKVEKAKNLFFSLKRNFNNIEHSYNVFNKALKEKKNLPSPCYWILDNFYLIQREYKFIKWNSSLKYFSSLPKVDYEGRKFIRAYNLCEEFLAIEEGVISEEELINFLKDYGKKENLSMEELWSVPLFLRIAIINRLSMISLKLCDILNSKIKGETLGETFNSILYLKDKKINISNFKKDILSYDEYGVSSLYSSLQQDGLASEDFLNSIEDILKGNNSSYLDCLNKENSSIDFFEKYLSAYIPALKYVSSLNFNKVFEKVSFVEEILKEDPAGIYKDMDFASRDYYRNSIIKLSKKLKVSQIAVAEKCIHLSLEGEEPLKKHIGFYLLTHEGKRILKNRINSKNIFKEKFLDFCYNYKEYLYILFFLMCFVLTLSFTYNSLDLSSYPIYFKAFYMIILTIPISEIVLSILNWCLLKLTPSDFIPKMSLKDGIKKDLSCAVVIPAIVNSKERALELLEYLEVYFLGNREKNLYFALLCDLKDSPTETLEDDKIIIDAALEKVNELNLKYSKETPIFYFLNRKRIFNPKENLYIGYERKRGKLMEFNSLIRGNKNTSFNIFSSNIEPLFNVKYVITLDSDTELPRGTCKKLLGIFAHPLNTPVIDESSKQVIRGFGVIQPRIGVSCINGSKSFFSYIFSGEKGFDTYSSAVSDIYQDLFHNGIFTGKGIYSVDVFNTILPSAIKENSVLSHDLLEGILTKCGLASDIQLIDGYPSSYKAFSSRLNRWIRGDWQLVPYIFHKGISAIDRFKILDNLRRSLFSFFFLLTLFFSIFLKGKEEVLLILSTLSLIVPLLFTISDNALIGRKTVDLKDRTKNVCTILERFFLILAFVPHRAINSVTSICKAIYRMAFSKKKLLEWQTSYDSEMNSLNNLSSYIKYMWFSPLSGITLAILSYSNSLRLFYILSPLAILWFFSPYIAFSISKPLKNNFFLQDEDKTLIRSIGIKTFYYFNDFINDVENFIPPDNVQEEPDNGIAHRTSPTNIGMAFNSYICGYELGFLSLTSTLENIKNTFETVNKLPKYKGHLFNWYNTLSLEPLYPKYISTVDSGNFCAYLWLTSNFLYQLPKVPPLSKDLYEGLNDLLILSEEEIFKLLHIHNFYHKEIKKCSNYETTLVYLRKILIHVKDIQTEAKTSNELIWNRRLRDFVYMLLNELSYLFPWCESSSTFPNDLKEELNSLPFNIALEDLEEEYNKILNKYKDRVDFKFAILENNIKLSIQRINDLLSDCFKFYNKLYILVKDTDFKILFDEKQNLFSIGLDFESLTLNNCYYDLLASEARIASLVAIAKGDVKEDHWFYLSRSLTNINGRKGLVSWSGTAFEYLMPLLIVRNYPFTLFNQTYTTALYAQKKYCEEKQVPFGISESAYYFFDGSLNYQYKAFGVPYLGLKRGLSKDLVVSPYSSLMFLMVDKYTSLENIKLLIKEHALGKYGFYDSIDYTKNRLKDKEKAIVKTYMVHHEGMGLMAITNILKENVLQELFHSIPKIKSCNLLLQEKEFKNVVYNRENTFDEGEEIKDKGTIMVRKYTDIFKDFKECALLSNGNYSLMVTSSGGGFSKKEDTFLYRYKEDATLDNYGMFFFIRNLNSLEYWSAAYEPSKKMGENYEALFSLNKCEFKRKDGNILTHTEIVLMEEDLGEIRKLTFYNDSEFSRTIEVTSYMESTITNYSSDLVHPAFSNLFVTTEFIEKPTCLIAERRKRKEDDLDKFLMHSFFIKGETLGAIEYETSRFNFIGRGNTLKNPKVMDDDHPLTNTVGAVLDPILSFRVKLKIPAKSTSSVSFITAFTHSKKEALNLAAKYMSETNINKAFTLSLNRNSNELKLLNLKPTHANMFQIMSSRILFKNPSYLKREGSIKNLSRGQNALWPYGISGDLPIVTCFIENIKDFDPLKTLLNSHNYLSLKGLAFDFIIISGETSSYMQPTYEGIFNILRSMHMENKINTRGGIFLINKSNLYEEDLNFIKAVSRLVFKPSTENIMSEILYESPNSKHKKSTSYNSFKESTSIKEQDLNSLNLAKNINIDNSNYNKEDSYSYSSPISKDDLLFFNSFGGFTSSGDEYVILLKDKLTTPAPWINVIANKDFGFLVSERGSSCTWCKNSRENKLSYWNNDPIIDGENECIYVKDEDENNLFSISQGPIDDGGEYIVKHGLGYSTFIHEKNGLVCSECLFTPKEGKSKIIILTLKNLKNKTRNIAVSYYARIVLGVTSELSYNYISTYIRNNKNYIYCKNPYNTPFKNLLCYMGSSGKNTSFTGDRKEFLGFLGSLNNPEGLLKETLSNSSGSIYDPCMALLDRISLNPLEETSLIFTFGEEESLEEIDSRFEKFNSFEKANLELNNVTEFWKSTVSTFQIKTPDKASNLLVNNFLLYQILSCRIWGRTAFYQSGGAFGFRDQLQDFMSFSMVNPNLCKEHILLASSHQFLEGDVEHWWHPYVGSGIRTNFSDDLLWLPFVTSFYIKNTGDFSILLEETPYLEGEPLKEGEDERYSVSTISNIKENLYSHCIKAIKRSFKFGEHNLPLMGSGDWNDGMNTVGNKGKGESVWLGWFLYKILNDFLPLCDYMKDNEQREEFTSLKGDLKTALEGAFDGSWYRRAYFDDGTPLGSSSNEECTIDSLSQSWAVISGAGNDARCREAIGAVEKYLLRREEGILLLLYPPFNKSSLNPGYIKGYVPGVRENGGQYTHGSVWTIIALALLKENKKAFSLFSLINPINHSSSYISAQKYKVEPYVICADIYGVEPHIGRGGWSFYTGAAGWMYIAFLNYILGFNLEYGKGFTLDPCIPDDWNEFSITYRKSDDEIYNILATRESHLINNNTNSNEEYSKGMYLNGTKLKNSLVPFGNKGINEVKFIF